MKKLYKYVEPRDPANDDWSAVEIIVSSDEIIEDYWPWWSQKMLSLGRTPTIEDCIEDFCVTQWATEIK